MPTKQTTLPEEMVAAARGVFAVVIGDRRSAGFFDFSQRGLVGSFVAFLTAVLVNGVTTALLLPDPPAGGFGRELILIGILYAVQTGLCALILRQFGRLDALVPYLVVTNWANLVVAVVSTALFVLGDLAGIIALVVGLVLQVNVARLIMTLSLTQIVLFLVAQLVGLTVAFLALIFLFPGLMPELAGAITAASTMPAQ